MIGKAPPKLFGHPQPNWESAATASAGYESALLVASAFESAKQVQSRRFAFERDGLLFEDPNMNLPVVAACGLVKDRSADGLRILDVGGGLGTDFFRHLELLDSVGIASWVVLETERMIEAATKLDREERLHFVASLDDALATEPDVILFSSSLQYFEDPGEIMEAALDSSAEVILIDRAPIWDKGYSAPVVQRTPKGMVQGSYPCWLFSEDDVCEWAGVDWTLVSKFDAVGGVWSTDSADRVLWMGFIFHRKTLAGWQRTLDND